MNRSLFGLLVTQFYMQHNVINTVQLQQVDILISYKPDAAKYIMYNHYL